MDRNKIDNTYLSSDTCERDLGIPIDHRLGMNQQCVAATKIAKEVLGCISRNTVL